MSEIAASIAPFAQISAVGALVFVLILLFRAVSAGDWVPRRELDYIRADRDARLQEKDREIAEWRAVAATERTGREVVTDQNRILIDGFATLNRTLDALRANAESNRGSPK